MGLLGGLDLDVIEKVVDQQLSELDGDGDVAEFEAMAGSGPMTARELVQELEEGPSKMTVASTNDNEKKKREAPPVDKDDAPAAKKARVAEKKPQEARKQKTVGDGNKEKKARAINKNKPAPAKTVDGTEKDNPATAIKWVAQVDHDGTRGPEPKRSVLETETHATTDGEVREKMDRSLRTELKALLRQHKNNIAELPFVHKTNTPRRWRVSAKACVAACKDETVKLPTQVTGLPHYVEGKVDPTQLMTVAVIPRVTPSIAKNMRHQKGTTKSEIFTPTVHTMGSSGREVFDQSRPASHLLGLFTCKSVQYTEGPPDTEHGGRRRFMPVMALRLTEGSQSCLYAGGSADNMVVVNRDVVMSCYFIGQAMVERAIMCAEHYVRKAKSKQLSPWPTELTVDLDEFMNYFKFTGYAKTTNGNEVRWFPWTKEKRDLEKEQAVAAAAKGSPVKKKKKKSPVPESKTRRVAKTSAKESTKNKTKEKPKTKTSTSAKDATKNKTKQGTLSLVPQKKPPPETRRPEVEENPPVTSTVLPSQVDEPGSDTDDGETPEEQEMDTDPVRPSKRRRVDPVSKPTWESMTLSDGYVVRLKGSTQLRPFNSRMLFMQAHDGEPNKSGMWTELGAGEKAIWKRRANEVNKAKGLKRPQRASTAVAGKNALTTGPSIKVTKPVKSKKVSNNGVTKDEPADPLFVRVVLGIMENKNLRTAAALDDYKEKLSSFFVSVIERARLAMNQYDEFNALLERAARKFNSPMVVFCLGNYARPGGEVAVLRVVEAAALTYGHKHLANKSNEMSLADAEDTLDQL